MDSPTFVKRVAELGGVDKAIRAVAVGVASGHYGEAELREAGADYVLASLWEPLPGLAAATVS